MGIRIDYQPPLANIAGAAYLGGLGQYQQRQQAAQADYAINQQRLAQQARQHAQDNAIRIGLTREAQAQQQRQMMMDAAITADRDRRLAEVRAGEIADARKAEVAERDWRSAESAKSREASATEYDRRLGEAWKLDAIGGLEATVGEIDAKVIEYGLPPEKRAEYGALAGKMRAIKAAKGKMRPEQYGKQLEQWMQEFTDSGIDQHLKPPPTLDEQIEKEVRWVDDPNAPGRKIPFSKDRSGAFRVVSGYSVPDEPGGQSFESAWKDPAAYAKDFSAAEKRLTAQREVELESKVMEMANERAKLQADIAGIDEVKAKHAERGNKQQVSAAEARQAKIQQQISEMKLQEAQLRATAPLTPDEIHQEMRDFNARQRAFTQDNAELDGHMAAQAGAPPSPPQAPPPGIPPQGAGQPPIPGNTDSVSGSEPDYMTPANRAEYEQQMQTPEMQAYMEEQQPGILLENEIKELKATEERLIGTEKWLDERIKSSEDASRDPAPLIQTREQVRDELANAKTQRAVAEERAKHESQKRAELAKDKQRTENALGSLKSLFAKHTGDTALEDMSDSDKSKLREAIRDLRLPPEIEQQAMEILQ